MKSSNSHSTPIRARQGGALGNADPSTTLPPNEQNHGGNAKRRKIIRILAYVLLGVFGVGLGSAIYLFQLVGQVGYSSVAIVNNADYTPIELGSLDSEQVAEGDTSSSWSTGGHTKVYVNEKFPIKKVAQKDPNVENILVFGIDSRGTDDVKCRADAVMIVSLDNNTKSIKLISLMRDTGVTIEGRSSTDKLTHSYAYGGVGLLINTINDNFGLDVQRFVMLDFKSSSSLIDLVGGIEIDVLPKEVKYANQSINEENMLLGTSVPLLTNSGMQTLNGVQAIAWSRIRHADSDFVRTSRQRAVAMALMKKVAAQNRIKQLSILGDSAGMFETNMTQADLLRVGSAAIGLVGNIVEYRIPDDGLYTVQENPWMMIIDWAKQIPKLHEYIWGRSDI